MNFKTHFCFELKEFGVALAFESPSSEVDEMLRARLLLSGWKTLPRQNDSLSVFKIIHGPRAYGAYENERYIFGDVNLSILINGLVDQIHHRIARDSEQIFVHAGVVGINGKALLLPGNSCTGKSTLTKALVDSGASYLSDEYAVVNRSNGLVHAFPREPRMRHPVPRTVPLSELGWNCIPDPMPIGCIATLTHQSVGWQVCSASGSDNVMALFANAVAAQRLGNDGLSSLARAVRGATGLKGTRGAAEEAAHKIIHLLQA